MFVNTGAEPASVAVSEWDRELAAAREVLKVDTSTGARIARSAFSGTVGMAGYGVAVVTNMPDTEVD